MKEGKIVKVFVVKTDNHTYYVQQMPGYFGMGIDYVVMKNRRVLYAERFNTAQAAVKWLLDYLTRENSNQLMIWKELDKRHLNI